VSAPVFTAFSAVSALGRGADETLRSLIDRRSGLRACDFPGMDPVGHIGRVAGLEDIELPATLGSYDCRNGRLAYAAVQCDGFAESVAAARERYGASRVAVVLGTSTSGMAEVEGAYRQRDESGALPARFRYRETQDLYSGAALLSEALQLDGPALVISTACSSSANALATAAQWIDAGVIDAAVAGGVDSLCLTTLRGFQALELISQEPCRPCDAERNGISLGEAAALMLIERAPRARSGDIALLGYGCSNDAHHMSAPHPEGLGARLAMERALNHAGLKPEQIDYINLHGTGTRFNDAAEDLAVHAIFGDRPACSSTKGWSGHTLGTAGALEAIISLLCIREELLPGCLNVSTLDPDLRSNVITANRPAAVRRVLSNSFGFGGNNCSLILGLAA
jgi:3-oxoacyl-[acyl-carrier-protein] synthase-1